MSSLWRIVDISEPGDLATALAIRREVFVREQSIPHELDKDGRDEQSLHVLGFLAARPVATGRLLVQPDGVAVIARIAVLAEARGQGLGGRIVQHLENLAARAGVHTLVLYPHAYLEEFYRRLGFTVTAGRHRVGDHDLITMAKALVGGNGKLRAPKAG